jgi:hypothetical protein
MMAEVAEANARAERAEAELAAEREKSERYRLASLKLDAELAAERARLDWLEQRGPWESWNVPRNEVGIVLRAPIRAGIDSALKEDAK